MKVIVIGAGPAGLACAYVLAKHGFAVQVFEAEPAVGGMSRSLELWDQIVDLGPHRFFTQERRASDLWLEVVGGDYAIVKRQTRILYGGKLIKYPLDPIDTLLKLGPVEAMRCIGSYIIGRMLPKHDELSFQDWVCSRFGKRLFEVFFKNYSEKLWGLPCGELDADFAAQRIRQFSLPAAIKSALLRRERQKHRTLAERFAYPNRGTGSVYERMAGAIGKWGGSVHLNAPVRRVLVKDGRVCGIELGSGEKITCDQVISSTPLPALVTGLGEVPESVLSAASNLRFRATILVYIEVVGANPFPDQWIYIHNPGLMCGRITNFRNWTPQLCGASSNTILAMEYWCTPGDDFWQQHDDAIERLAQSELLKCGLVGRSHQLGRSFVVRLRDCYPVYRRGYRVHLQTVRSYLESISGLQVIGRAGAFKYNNQDHSILMGLLAAENLLLGNRRDLWAVNADSDTYHEGCKISDTGLGRHAVTIVNTVAAHS